MINISNSVSKSIYDNSPTPNILRIASKLDRPPDGIVKKCTAFKIRATWTHVPSLYHYFYYYDYYHYYYYYYYYYCYFFCLFRDTRRLLLQFTFLWSSAKGEWHSKSLNTAERCSKVKSSSEALLKQILGSPFLDVCLKS